MGVATTPTQPLTSQQQQVVASYVHQKSYMQQKSYGAQQGMFVKRTPTTTQTYYCEVCKISCACAAVSVMSSLCHR